MLSDERLRQELAWYRQEHVWGRACAANDTSHLRLTIEVLDELLALRAQHQRLREAAQAVVDDLPQRVWEDDIPPRAITVDVPCISRLRNELVAEEVPDHAGE